jgi:signal transduction histidine kinase
MSLLQLTALQSLFKYQSGRVIALGRVMLGIMFLLAVAFDRSEPHLAIFRTYAMLTLYGAVAILVAVATWRDWWLDARLAGPAHLTDMTVFTIIVFSANGTTSPFFLFFVLPLLAAAIRWSWRETAITATALILLYLIAGSLIAGDRSFELERFVIRAGHLLNLSLLLIWFGIHQGRERLFFHADDLEAQFSERDNPLARSLEFVMRAVSAKGGALLIGAPGEEPSDGYSIDGSQSRSFTVERPLVRKSSWPAFLYDISEDHVLTSRPDGQFRFLAASELIDCEEARELGLKEGLIAEVRTGTLHGWLVLWDIPDLSTDYVDLARELGRAAGAILDRHALYTAIETGAAARTRLALARDVHDSVIQFLAGTAIRLEAIKRTAKSGRAVESDIDDLKRLLVEEQGELRGFVAAIRRDREVDLAEAVAELRSLAERLSEQWSIECSVSAHGEPAAIPIRLQLDLQHLLREAVANAVRHGGAKKIDVALDVHDDRLQLDVADNGSGFGAKGAAVEPWSLKERVERAHGSLRLVSAPGATNISISLPLGAAA